MLLLILHAWASLALIASYHYIGIHWTAAALSIFSVIYILSISNEIAMTFFLWVIQSIMRKITCYPLVRLRLTHRMANIGESETKIE